MTGTEIITKFENLVDDELDGDLALQLVNDAIHEIEDLRDWEILKRVHTFTCGTGLNPETALPTRFAFDISLHDNSNVPYDKVNRGDAYQVANRSNGYYLDLEDEKLGLTGTIAGAQLMSFAHTVYSADLSLSTEWGFPERFHGVIPYKMAEIYYAIDAGEKSRAWDDRWAVRIDDVINRMEIWDDRLKAKNYNNQSNFDNPKGIDL